MYDYTKQCFDWAYGTGCGQISSGIYRVVGVTKNHPASFLRIKSHTHDRDRLEATVKVLVSLLNNGSINESEDMIIDWGYGELLH